MNYQAKVIKISAEAKTTEITGPVLNNLTFQPDEMILRSFSYAGDAVGTAYQLWTDLTDDGILVCFPAGGPNAIATTIQPELHFDMTNKKISGTAFTFQIQDIATGTDMGSTTANAIGAWGLMLEFRKYKRKY